MHTRAKGRIGEEAAVQYLLSQGYTVVSRNYQTRNGEIDCVAQSPEGVLVFIEVKASRNCSRGHPFFRVTRAKQRKLAVMAQRYLADHGITEQRCRFDVVAVIGLRVEHMPNAFWA